MQASKEQSHTGRLASIDMDQDHCIAKLQTKQRVLQKKYFGKQDPIGKTLTFYSGESYAMPLTVTGVLKDVPVNSTIQFGFITNFENYLKGDGSKIAPDDWTWMLDAAFFKIPKASDVPVIAKSLSKYVPIQNKARMDWKATGFQFISLREHAVLSDIETNAMREVPITFRIPISFSLLFACDTVVLEKLRQAERKIKIARTKGP